MSARDILRCFSAELLASLDSSNRCVFGGNSVERGVKGFKSFRRSTYPSYQLHGDPVAGFRWLVSGQPSAWVSSAIRLIGKSAKPGKVEQR